MTPSHGTSINRPGLASPARSGARSPWVTRANAVLAAANVAGAVIYVARASAGWRDPFDSVTGVDSTAGEPFIWALSIAPVVATFLLVNLVWVAAALVVRGRPRRRYWLAAAAVWAVALAVDFGHH